MGRILTTFRSPVCFHLHCVAGSPLCLLADVAGYPGRQPSAGTPHNLRGGRSFIVRASQR